MATPLTIAGTSARTRLPLATLGKLTLIALLGLALCLAYLQAAIIGALIPPLAVFTVVSLLVAGLVGIGWRWTPALGALWSAFLIDGNSADVIYNFAHPNHTHQFTFTVVTLAMAVVGVAAGVSAAVQNYRGGARSTPRVPPFVLTALVALRLDNRDSEAHSFDIDELNIHAPMPAGQSVLALFKPSKSGTYTFYCSIPAHRTFMVGTLIVEP
jgi:hypothetical protein